MIVFFAVLASATLLILESWQENEVPLGLGGTPGLQGAVGDAVAVGRGPAPGVASARVAPPGQTTLLTAASAVGGGDGEGEGAARPAVAIAPARAVAEVQPSAPASLPQAPAPAAPPAAQPQPASPPPPPAALPVSLPASGSAPEPESPGRGGSEGGVEGPIGSGSGPGEGHGSSFEAAEGVEYRLSFSFEAEPTAYRAPGVENAVASIEGSAAGPPSVALQLWDDGNGNHGLWASGGAVGGERFLAPLADGVEHEVAVDFRAAGEDEGLYVIFLDGSPVDAAGGVDLLEAGSGAATVEVRLFREGEAVAEPADVRFGAAALLPLEPVLP